MKTVALAALALAVAAPALAQTPPAATPQPAPGVAAATLPNTMDGPVTARQTPAPTASAASAQASSPEVVARAEAALRATIAAAQAGAMNYDDMTDNLATQVRAQSAQVLPLIQGFGALRTVEHRGRENGAELFAVAFENAQTQWIIGHNPDGEIAALLFRPAP